MAHLGAHTGWHYGWHFGGSVPAVGGSGAVGTLVIDIESGAQVTYEWRTDIEKSWSGLEQRIGLLAKPRQRYQFRSLLNDDQGRLLMTTLSGSAHNAELFLLGLPFEELTVKSASSGGSTTDIVVQSLALCDWAVAGQRVIVIHPDGETSVDSVIQTAAGATINVFDDITAVAVEGARIMPAMSCYLTPQQGLGRFRTAMGAWSISALAEKFRFGTTGSVGAGATLTEYDDLVVWDKGAVLDTERTEGLDSGVSIIDQGMGIGAISEYGRSDWTRELRMHSSSRADWQWLKLFLDTVNGRRASFLVPSYRPDLSAVGDASTGDLIVSDTYFADWFFSLAHRRLRIVLIDGSIHYRTIENAFANLDGTSTLELDSALAGTIERLEFLELCRLESDAVTVTWDGIAFQCATTARVVQR